MSSIKKHRRALGFVAVGSVLAACSVDTSDLHFVPDEALTATAGNLGTGDTGSGATGADDAGGAATSGGSPGTGGSGNKAGATGKAGAGTGTGGVNTAGAPGTAGFTNGGNQPLGGMGGMPLNCPGAVANRNEPLIDNFDDGDPGLPLPPLGGRVGGWFVVNDGSAFGTQVPPANDPTRPPKPVAPGFDGRGYALVTNGKGFMQWGAGLGMTFSNGPNMKACVYDAAIHAGIRFRAMGSITGPDPLLHVHVVTTDVADREHSGNCDALNEKCYDNFNFDVALTGAGKWQEVIVPFAEVKQAGWGAPKKFYPNHLLNLEFVAGVDASFDFAIDQVEFY
jgi:hypothetical protein